MPIVTLDEQRRMRELGRIRTGVQVVSSDGKKRRPAKLETFRLTSSSRMLVDAAAAAYGGEVKAWGDQWEVVTKTTTLDIIIPPGQPLTQWFELWSGGGCERRCDGRTNVLTMTPCACPVDPAERNALAADGLACKPTTRLSVILPALPDLGIWRLESHGFNAAVELAGAAEILVIATQNGHLLPARLRLEQREKKVPGKPTNKYAVPIIEFVETRMADLQLLAPGEGGTAGRLPLGRPAVPALPATTLPATSDFRAPLPERPLTEPTLEVAQDSLDGGAVAARPVARGAEAICGATSNPDLGDVVTCNLRSGHLDPKDAPRVHRLLKDGESIIQWPAS